MLTPTKERFPTEINSIQVKSSDLEKSKAKFYLSFANDPTLEELLDKQWWKNRVDKIKLQYYTSMLCLY